MLCSADSIQLSSEATPPLPCRMDSKMLLNLLGKRAPLCMSPMGLLKMALHCIVEVFGDSPQRSSALDMSVLPMLRVLCCALVHDVGRQGQDIMPKEQMHQASCNGRR
jgi:hypothetical protein